MPMLTIFEKWTGFFAERDPTTRPGMLVSPVSATVGELRSKLDQAIPANVYEQSSEGSVARHVGYAKRRIISSKKNSRVVTAPSRSSGVLDSVDRE